MKKDVDNIVVKITPQPKPRMVKSDSWKKRPVVLRYWDFKDEIKKQVEEAGFELGERHKVVFHMPMAKSWSKKKKAEMDGKPHKQRPDLDNMCKALWDSLLDEDSACYYLVASKKWAKEGMIVIDNYPEESLEF